MFSILVYVLLARAVVMDTTDLLLTDVKRMVALILHFSFVGYILFKGLTGWLFCFLKKVQITGQFFSETLHIEAEIWHCYSFLTNMADVEKIDRNAVNISSMNSCNFTSYKSILFWIISCTWCNVNIGQEWSGCKTTKMKKWAKTQQAQVSDRASPRRGNRKWLEWP